MNLLKKTIAAAAALLLLGSAAVCPAASPLSLKPMSASAATAVTKYTITFNANGGSCSTKSKTVAKNAAIGTLPTPTRKGYNFGGWYNGSSKISSTTKITKSYTVKAKWNVIKYTVSFNSVGGSSVSSKIVTYDSTYGTLSTPSKNGYTFTGWHLESASGAKITSSSKVTTAKNHKLVATWKGNQYTVTFKPNGGTCSVKGMTVRYMEPYGALPTPSRTGYNFGGWHPYSFTNQVTIKSYNAVNIMGNHDLVASWTPIYYTLTFNANGGTCTTASKRVAYDSTYGSLPTPTRSGYNFTGWYTGTASSAAKVSSSTVYNTTSNKTLYAHWVKK